MPEKIFIAERSDGAVINLHNSAELAALNSLNPIPRDRAWMQLYLLRDWGMNPRLNEARRSPERQAKLFAEGKSQVKHSRHEDGDAWDICDHELGWNASKEFWRAVGRAARIVGAVWGGSWKSFPDPAHTEWQQGKIVG